MHPDEGVQQAQAVNSAEKDATTARRAPAINRPRNVVTVPQNNVARAAHANQSYGDHRRKVGNSCSAPGARAETRDELCNSGCCYKPLYRDFLTTARSTWLETPIDHPGPYTGTRTVLVCSSRPRGSAAAAGGRTAPRTPPCAGGGPKGPETTPIILGRQLGALLRRWGGGQAPN